MPKAAKKRGKLVVIDGIDGTGKTTQVELLVGRLKNLGWRVKGIKFPLYEKNFFAKLIEECLNGKHGDFLAIDPHIVSVLYAADRWEAKEQIEQWLAAGYLVLADRYVSANQIHQGGKIDDPAKREKFMAWLDTMEHEVFGIPRPNLIIFLDLPIEASQRLLTKRYSGKAKDQAESNLDHLTRTRRSAEQLVASKNNWVKIDCAPDGELLTKADIHLQIIELVSKEFEHKV
jgi:dTMP kinase